MDRITTAWVSLSLPSTDSVARIAAAGVLVLGTAIVHTGCGRGDSDAHQGTLHVLCFKPDDTLHDVLSTPLAMDDAPFQNRLTTFLDQAPTTCRLELRVQYSSADAPPETVADIRAAGSAWCTYAIRIGGTGLKLVNTMRHDAGDEIITGFPITMRDAFLHYVVDEIAEWKLSMKR